VNREQLEHVLRAATDIVAGADIVVIGSQSILASVDAERLPPEAVRSIEVDIAFEDDPDAAKADRIDGAIGELSRFHQAFGYYGQGVSLSTAVLPEGWQERLVDVDPPREGARVRALEPHDCVTSKLVAWRPKDLEYAAALLAANIVDKPTLLARIAALPAEVAEPVRVRMRSWVERQAGLSNRAIIDEAV
jgi:hypothetical protein